MRPDLEVAQTPAGSARTGRPPCRRAERGSACGPGMVEDARDGRSSRRSQAEIADSKCLAAVDPVGAGPIPDLARPGGNITGLSFLTTDLAAKRLQLLRELVPGVARIALLAWDLGARDPATRERGPTVRFIAETEAAGRQLGAEVKAYLIDSASDLPQAFAAIEQARSQALIVKNNSLTYDLRQAILEASKRLRIPDMYEVRELVMAGGLVSDGPNVPELYRQSAGYVDSILKGPSHRTFRSSSPPSSNWCSISRPPRRSA